MEVHYRVQRVPKAEGSNTHHQPEHRGCQKCENGSNNKTTVIEMNMLIEFNCNSNN